MVVVLGAVVVCGLAVVAAVFGVLSSGLKEEVERAEVLSLAVVTAGLSPPHEHDAVTISVVTSKKSTSAKSSVRFMAWSFLG